MAGQRGCKQALLRKAKREHRCLCCWVGSLPSLTVCSLQSILQYLFFYLVRISLGKNTLTTRIPAEFHPPYRFAPATIYFSHVPRAYIAQQPSPQATALQLKEISVRATGRRSRGYGRGLRAILVRWWSCRAIKWRGRIEIKVNVYFPDRFLCQFFVRSHHHLEKPTAIAG